MNRLKKPVPETPDDDGCRCRQASAESVLAMPAGIDPDWRERIALAKRAYQDGKKLRRRQAHHVPNDLAPVAGQAGRRVSDRWIEAFRQDPQMAVANLFTGRGAGSSMRLDVPELLRLWFPPSLAEERAQLDDALLAWLLEMRESCASQINRLGLSAYGKRIGDALIALQLLDLPRAKGEIRENMDAWLRWLTPLRTAPERDPALECLRLLTQGQTDVARRHMAAPRCGRSSRVSDRGASRAAAAAQRRREEEPSSDAAGVAASRNHEFPRGDRSAEVLQRPVQCLA